MNRISAEVWEAAYSLEQTWQHVAEQWQDATADEFADQCWRPLAETTVAYIDAARELDAVIAIIHSLRTTA